MVVCQHGINVSNVLANTQIQTHWQDTYKAESSTVTKEDNMQSL